MKKINLTHIMVIRKNAGTGMLETDFLPLVFKDQEKLNDVERFYRQASNATGKDIYSFACSNGLGYLFNSYDYCMNVNGSYQACPYVLPMIAEKMSAVDCFYLLKSRVTAYCLREKIRECHEDRSIVAYSSCFIGWHCTHFDLNEELSIEYHTNFGYGYANYFTANLKYKDIDILPYSLWVHYFKANLSEIRRYTRVYEIHNDEWEPALRFGCEVYNSLLQNPHEFVNTWFVKEVQEMVRGLRAIFNNQCKVIAENYSNNSKIELKSKEDIILFKGEKMSGALSFIEKIKELEKLDVSMTEYITAILDMNRQMVPQLEEVIEEYEHIIEDLKAEYAELVEEMSPYESFVESHVHDCAINFIGSDNYFGRNEAKSLLCGINPYFAMKSSTLDDYEKRARDLRSNISNGEYVKNTLSGYLKTIQSALEKNQKDKS